MAELIPVHRFVDPGLNYLFTTNYDLSIRILSGGFAYTVFDTLKEKFIAVEEFEMPATSSLNDDFGSGDQIKWLDEISTMRYLLKEKFNKVSVLIGGGKYTLVPLPLFDPQSERKYLAFNHQVSGHDIIRHDKIKAPETCLVYAVPVLLNTWLNNQYPHARVYHTCGSLLRGYYLQNKGANQNITMMANIQAGSFDLIIFRTSSLLFCNSFRYSTETDLLYYLLFVMEQLKLDPETAILTLTGIAENGSELVKLLGSYIRNVQVIQEVPGRKLSPALDNAPLHRYYDLLNLALCG